MAVHIFKLPDIGEGIAEAEIAQWKVAVGEVIAEDQPLCDMLTDKAAVEIPSPVAGTVLELKGAAGDMVAVGGALVLIEVEAAATAPGRSDASREAAPVQGEAGFAAEAAPTPAAAPRRSDASREAAPVQSEAEFAAEAAPTPAAAPRRSDASREAAPVQSEAEFAAEAAPTPAAAPRGSDASREAALVQGEAEFAAEAAPTPAATPRRSDASREAAPVQGEAEFVAEAAPTPAAAPRRSDASREAAPVQSEAEFAAEAAPTPAAAPRRSDASREAALVQSEAEFAAEAAPRRSDASRETALVQSEAEFAAEAAPTPATAPRRSDASREAAPRIKPHRQHGHLPRAPGEKPLASPAVRQRARELGIELAYVHGNGPAGRISHDDLEAFIARGGSTPSIGRQARTGVEQIKVIGLRRKIGQAMQRSKQRIPHFAYVEECDVTELEKLRQHMNAHRAEGQVKLSLLPFLMQALVKAVPEFPQINANFDDEAGILHRIEALHIGIAAQTENGLVVPVVHHAETLDIWGMGSELKRLAEAARDGTAAREELSGSSITISSLGPLGGIVSTPVINAPEVAIVGVNKMLERPVVINGRIEVRTMMNLSSSFDHRIVDGWDAASFIQRIKGYLEHPASLFI